MSIRALVTRGSRALAGPGFWIDAFHINQIEDLPVLRVLNQQSLQFFVSPPSIIVSPEQIDCTYTT
jgi:hypothetical protein